MSENEQNTDIQPEAGQDENQDPGLDNQGIVADQISFSSDSRDGHERKKKSYAHE